MYKHYKLILICLFGIITFSAYSQKKEDAAIAKMIQEYKQDIRGPYKDIRWFCKDGTINQPKEPCGEVGGFQRARYKDAVDALAKSNKIYFGQILATTSNEAFWDAQNNQSRLKQFSLEHFLRANDNGWINRRAQFYRGAYQIEDEEAWGIGFLQFVLSDTQKVNQNFFLIRQSAKDLPHAGDNNTTQSVRAVSREISDLYIPFMDLRVKIHGQPDQGDIQKVIDFRAKNKSKFDGEVDKKFAKLIADMEIMYRPIQVSDFKSFVKKMPVGNSITVALNDFITYYGMAKEAAEKTQLISQLALLIRQDLLTVPKASARLALLDVSNKLEMLMNREAPLWQPKTLEEQLFKARTLVKAEAGFGYLEQWEWEIIEGDLTLTDGEEITLQQLNDFLERSQKAVEWGTGMVRSTYQDVIKLFAGFEPLAYGLVDDKVRSSVLLELGSTVSVLGDFFSSEAGFSNQVMDIENQSSMRGLNPGYAFGELVVTNQSPEDIEVSKDKIYVFNRPPADLKPVAGIATVTEGNMVSHVQLLARNLGIPNAVLSPDNLLALLPYNGQKVFYAVSNKGTVLIKPAIEMTEEEQALFASKTRSEEMISVPVELMELNDPRILNLRDVNASHSGILCGPKAANLGQLKLMFPDHVVEGLVIPFSIFRQHFDQPMPGKDQSYWEFLNAVFDQARKMQEEKEEAEKIEKFVLGELEILRAAIKEMPLYPEFQKDLRQQFVKVFEKEMGQIPVFLRSDTNMEDLKDFTGAGLNLTLFNVLDEEKIFQGIKDVWASPYAERSYMWRQRYLLNPENVFPSILIIPSVNADYSGVLITKGISSGVSEDVTIAFNRGVGGAVEGQASESWLLKADGENLMLSPAREPEFISIPETGGSQKVHTTFEKRLLSESRLSLLRFMTSSLLDKLAATGMKWPYDVELGFKDDHIWLFQVRPFVENKRAASSLYLQSITSPLNGEKSIPLNTSL